ncbi:hypothetical protein AWM79_18380 [Pseudomonas agarici]|uniref:Uncharacterized protein n=1 Tax=Pseudomonas agarici TaxID=46677 RepID=A0A0X1T542_PSEAA|nr:hypothetical protein [Pseudomonas agarici]AMB87160.1 hypothetical protein AWM79_18380 [Pseudomonas agarici]NWB93308.1 hypothetical protein [Pseudomonas agarici]
MIDFTADIKSMYSAANIFLGDNISMYTDELYTTHQVEIKKYSLPNNKVRFAYVVDGTITIATLPNGTIFSIGCNSHYQGFYRGILSTGMSFSKIQKLTKRQRILNGTIIIDDDFGFFYVLPAPYDEIADSIVDIPQKLILDEAYISDLSFLE